jgi:hypothetical protein
MSIIVKAKSLPKNPTDAPADLINLADAKVDANPIITFASKIEKVTTRIEVEENIKKFRDAREFDFFKLGGAIAVAQSLFTKKKSEFEGYKNFGHYIEAVHGIPYGKAMHAARMYRKLVDLDVPWSAFENIGWTKVRLLLDVVTKQGTSTITTKTFKLHEDQKQLVNDAIKKAQAETGSAVEAANIEAICQSYIGAGLLFPDWEPAFTYAAKHTNDAAALVQKLVAMAQDLFPQLSIAVEITFKESAPAA